MDFKKTILWAVFSLSGLMLYNNWLVHEGRPSLLGGAPVTSSATPAGSAQEKTDIPAQISGSPVSTQAPLLNLGSIDSAEKFTLENDVLALQISANGANVVDAKLLKALTADQEPVELFQYNLTHKYFARSGLIALGNLDLPNH